MGLSRFLALNFEWRVPLPRVHFLGPMFDACHVRPITPLKALVFLEKKNFWGVELLLLFTFGVCWEGHLMMMFKGGFMKHLDVGLMVTVCFTASNISVG